MSKSALRLSFRSLRSIKLSMFWEMIRSLFRSFSFWIVSLVIWLFSSIYALGTAAGRSRAPFSLLRLRGSLIFWGGFFFISYCGWPSLPSYQRRSAFFSWSQHSRTPPEMAVYSASHYTTSERCGRELVTGRFCVSTWGLICRWPFVSSSFSTSSSISSSGRVLGLSRSDGSVTACSSIRIGYTFGES